MAFITLSVFLILLTSAIFGDKSTDSCSTKRTCGTCIAASPLCSWCTQEPFEWRCDTSQNLLRKNCSVDNIVSPQSKLKTIKDDHLSAAGVKSDVYVQLKPQKVHLKLRPHEVINIPVEFRQAEDYPVDLYYLMDLTNSMRDDKTKISELGDAIAEQMSKVTNKFRMGFGSFVDKVVLPYVSTVPAKLINPCLDGVVCKPPYSFRNHLSLTSQTERFVQEVEAADVSGNLDDAEGGFDAVMQVLVCKETINWNDASRKIVLFATDSGFHYAGDGKLGGAVLPNDEHCHLDADGYYTMGAVYDYPSISQLNRKAKEDKVVLIFAVTENQLKPYTNLSQAIEGAHIQELASDSSNIVQLVQELYQEISSKVELKADNVPDYIKMNFQSVCPDGKKGNHLCRGLKVGTTISFNISLELEACPKVGGSWSHSITVYPVGLNEKLEIQLEMLCECDCEMADQEEVNSTFCSGFGTYECGICSCDDRHYGRLCECNSTLDEEKNLAFCKVENSTILCSNRGDCVCGVCECWPRDNPDEEVSGPQCQCDNFSCDRDKEQEVCGGKRRGKCECGKCECHPGWSGSVCSCTTSNETCIGTNGQICSGNGVCSCGGCVCSSTAEGRFGGATCDDCPGCLGKCNEFKPCVQCLVWGTGELSTQECETNCSSFTVYPVPKLQYDSNKQCTFQDEEGCMCQFTYFFTEDNKPVVHAEEDRDCPKQANVPFIILGLVGAIFLIGLAVVLIGRLVFYVKDKRAVARFLKEVEETKWSEEQNPLFKAATSNFTNPTYGRKLKE